MTSDDPRALKPARPRGAPITIDLDGETVRAYAGEPVAVALFAGDVRVLARSPKYHRPRGLFCGTGHCGSCLMRIDGRPNVPSCMTPARPDLRCERQNAFPDPEIDLLAAADWLFPGGMDHHRLMTGSRIGNELFVKLVRQMGGSGLLPERPADARPAPRDLTVDLCVVGAGPAGLTAARTVAQACPGRQVLLVDDQADPGGSLLAEPDGAARAAALVAAATAAGVRIEPSATAIGVYLDPEDQERHVRHAGAHAQPASPRPESVPALAPGILAIHTPGGLLRVRAQRFLYATGAYDQNLPFGDNDRPGTLAARAVGRLAFFWGVSPGRRVILVAGPQPQMPYLEVLAQGLTERGIPVTRTDVDGLPGTRPKIDLHHDVIAVGALPAPASELPRQHGGQVRFDLALGGFSVVRGPDGGASTGVFVAGDVAGFAGPAAAAADGARVGAALAKELAAQI